MLFDQETFVGVDPASGRRPFVWAALNQDREIVALQQGSLDELITFIRGIPQVVVAINSPRSISKGLLQDPINRHQITPVPRPGRFTRYRICEYQLKIRNIRVIPVPQNLAQTPGWMKNAFQLYADLKAYPSIRVVEVNAHACYCALLGRIPFIKYTLEGRIQRQLVLSDSGIRLRDPMNFFEEITRRRLLQGILPEGILLPVRELDCLAGALTGWQNRYQPQNVLAVGDEEEGQIILPVQILKDRYS